MEVPTVCSRRYRTGKQSVIEEVAAQGAVNGRCCCSTTGPYAYVLRPSRELHMRTDYEWVPSPMLEALQRPITMQLHPVGGDLSSPLKVCPPFRLRLELFYVILRKKGITL